MPKKYDGEVLVYAVWIGKSREPWMLLEAIVLYDGIDDSQRISGNVVLKLVGEGVIENETTTYKFSQSLWRTRVMAKL